MGKRRNYNGASCVGMFGGVVMRSHIVLILLAFAGAAFCWWPFSIEPRILLPSWSPLLCVALAAFLSTALCASKWWWFAAASVIGAFAGLSTGCLIWWPSDPIAGPWVPISIAVNTIIAIILAFSSGAAARWVPLSAALPRRAGWFALACCVAFGPVTLGLTRPVVARRVAFNDRAAAERFESLRRAVRLTALDVNGRIRICDGAALKRRYSGPKFSGEDWRRITGNYVAQDGYFFMIYCHERGGYTIDALPVPTPGEGTRHFCAEESGRVGCGMTFDGSRHTCTPCAH